MAVRQHAYTPRPRKPRARPALNPTAKPVLRQQILQPHQPGQPHPVRHLRPEPSALRAALTTRARARMLARVKALPARKRQPPAARMFIASGQQPAGATSHLARAAQSARRRTTSAREVPVATTPPHARARGESNIAPGRLEELVRQQCILHARAMAPARQPMLLVRAHPAAAGHIAHLELDQVPGTAVPQPEAPGPDSAGVLAEMADVREHRNAHMSAAWPPSKRNQPARSPFHRRLS